MSDRPLVSVLTPTWQRHDLLLGAIDDVIEQTYRPLELVIVSDGPDAALREIMDDLEGEDGGVRIRFVELGRNWSTFLTNSFCAAPIVVAQLVARGEYQMFLSDDERMEPDHIASLVDALEAASADFAYSKVRMYYPHQTPDQGWDIGMDPPQSGQITNALWRADLLARAGLYPFGAGMTSDWQYISNWQSKGATHAFVNRVTMTHRADH